MKNKGVSKMKALKVLCFMIAWIVSAMSAAYIIGSIINGTSAYDWVYYICAFVLSMMYLIFNHIK